MNFRALERSICAITLIALAHSVRADEPKQNVWPKSWTQPREPFVLFGNTYYIGTEGLTSVLITSARGHVLIDGTMPESAALVLENVRKLGFSPSDIKYILNSHAHLDHSGGIAEIQKATGAIVLSSPAGARALRGGRGGPDDPQYSSIEPFPPIATVKEIEDGATIELGAISLTIHYTPGHTPGGTSWSWRACESSRCLNLVYADSLNAVSADDFRFSGDARYPNAADDLSESIAKIASLPCDVIVSAHPEGSGLWEKIARREAGEPDALVDPSGCRAYAEGAQGRLAERLARERKEHASD